MQPGCNLRDWLGNRREFSRRIFYLENARRCKLRRGRRFERNIGHFDSVSISQIIQTARLKKKRNIDKHMFFIFPNLRNTFVERETKKLQFLCDRIIWLNFSVTDAFSA